METAFKMALSMLPLHAEENGRREVIPERDLVDALVGKSISRNTATALIHTLRRQFEALALLDPEKLRKGKWAFVSFPASLLGRSWLTTLATPDQTLFQPGYWGSDAPDRDKEEQRALLHRIETARVQFNPHAQPVRIVHVAWGLIRIGNKFLMHHREDKARPGEKSYGLPGGRFNLSDLPPEVQSREDILKETFRLDSAIVQQYIKKTLERELEEETDLSPTTHYTCETFGEPLPPYMEVNGAGNKHAYSAYRFYLYRIKLTHAGETHLFSRTSRTPDRLKWFTADDILAPQRTNGDSAYVAALHQAWGKDMRKRLLEAPESGTSPAFTGESMMLDLPEASDAAFQLGKRGKEKAVYPSQTLEEEEWKLLMLLGWHVRDFQITLAADSSIRLLENGWVEMPGIIQLAHSLHQKTQPVLPDLVEIRENRFVCLRISPDILFFSTRLFRYAIRGNDKNGGKFQLGRVDLTVPWGKLNGDSYERSINANTVAALRELERGDDPQESGDWERSLREQFGENTRMIGLRILWSTKNKMSCLVEGLEKMTATPREP